MLSLVWTSLRIWLASNTTPYSDLLSFQFVPCNFLKFYLFIYREGKGGRGTSMCGCLSCAPYLGPSPQPMHVP